MMPKCSIGSTPEFPIGPSQLNGQLHRCRHSNAALTHREGLLPLQAQTRPVRSSISSLHQQTAEREHARAETPADQPSADSTAELPSSRAQNLPGSAVQHEAFQSQSSIHLPCKQQSEKRAANVKPQRKQAPGFWCWEWANTRWRASFLFLLASAAFVIGSGASLQPNLLAGETSLIRKASDPL